MKKYFYPFIVFYIFLFTFKSSAQISLGADIYSRYIWRGIDFGNSPSFQPYISFKISGFQIGAWGSYSISNSSSSNYSENDLWASYSYSSNIGTFSAIVTDYYFPYTNLKYFNYDGAGKGAHTLETGLIYSGEDKLPIKFSAYYNFHNDIDNAIYLQLDLLFSVSTFNFDLFAGASPKECAWYGTDKFKFINLGLTATKQIEITDKFSIPFNISYIINPNIEVSYLIFGISI